MFWFLEPVESLGGRMAARKRGTSTCRLIRSLEIRSLEDYILCRRSFLTLAENGQLLNLTGIARLRLTDPP